MWSACARLPKTGAAEPLTLLTVSLFAADFFQIISPRAAPPNEHERNLLPNDHPNFVMPTIPQSIRLSSTIIKHD
jgi:hypothetical protein